MLVRNLYPSDDVDPLQNQKNISIWLRNQWDKVDVTRSDCLDLDRVTGVCARLNIALSKVELKSAFKNALIEANNCIPFSMFERLYRNLRFRSEISMLFCSLSLEDPVGLTYAEFEEFVLNVQKVFYFINDLRGCSQNDWTPSQCLSCYKKYTPLDGGLMDIDHFSALYVSFLLIIRYSLISAKNSILSKEYSVQFQAMDHPLEHYFINSSHNTYLLGDQIRGESSVEAYIKAFQRGCKCIESIAIDLTLEILVDCWDGAHGEPIVYHGGTLTSKIMLRNVLDVVERYAFVVSDYPVILSLEVRCSLEQQAKIAKISRSVFGQRLAIFQAGEKLPCLQNLSGKVLLKVKICELEDDDDEDDLRNSYVDSDTSVVGEMEKLLPNRKALHVMERRLIKRRRPSLSTSLMDLAALKTRKFPGFEQAKEIFLGDQMCSVSERKSYNLAMKQRFHYIRHNSDFLTRVYPSPFRINSSNFDPICHWKSGCQVGYATRLTLECR